MPKSSGWPCSETKSSSRPLDFPPGTDDNVEVGVKCAAFVDDSATGAEVNDFGVEFGMSLMREIFCEEEKEALDLNRGTSLQEFVQQLRAQVCH